MTNLSIVIKALNILLATRVIISLDRYVLFYLKFCLKYLENRGKNMSLMIEDDSVLVKYNEIWSNVKKTLNIKFHSMPVYNEKYIKAKIK